MIVTCPSCSAKYRVKDASVPETGAKMKCPKCGKFFAAHKPDKPEANPVPQPVQFTGAQVEAAAPAADPPSDRLAQEWDAMVTGERPAGRAPAGISLAAGESDPLAGMVVAGQATAQPRDPFYEDNPAVEEQPTSDQLESGFTQDLEMHSQGTFDASGGEAPAPTAPNRGELSDPFANIDLTAPASQPLAGSEARKAAAEAQRSAQPPTREPSSPPPAAPIAMDSGELPKANAGITIRDRSGQEHVFKYLPPARRWVAEHHDPEGLDVSIAGAPFAKVTRTHAFADLSFERTESSQSGLDLAPPAAAPKPPPAEVVEQETFPPPALPIAAELGEEEENSLVARIGLGAGIAVLALATLFAVWQFELLPIEPNTTRVIATATGARSPLLVPDLDTEHELALALEGGHEAEERGALALAIINYRRVLAVRRGDPDILRRLAHCYQQLGDESAVKELKRIAPRAFAGAKPKAAAGDQ